MKIFKKLYNWATEIMPPRENPTAVKNWQDWLNRTYPPGPWLPITGFTSTMTTYPGSNDTATFNPHNGYVMKAFLNTSTGEVKTFDAKRFYAK